MCWSGLVLRPCSLKNIALMSVGVRQCDGGRVEQGRVDAGGEGILERAAGK